MGHPRALFNLFSSFQTNITIFTTKICEKCPSSKQCWDSNPRPSVHESPPITTRPGLPTFPYLFAFERSCLSMYLQVYHLISFSSICVRRFFSQPLYLLFTSFVHLLLCLSFLSHLSTTCHVQTFFCCFASSSLQIDSTKIQRLVSLLKVTRLVSLFKVTRLVSWFKVTGLVSWCKITGLVSWFKITGL